MTEDDTYKVLKGLTRAEAEERYHILFELAMASHDTITMEDVEKFIDLRLAPYGWSARKLWIQK